MKERTDWISGMRIQSEKKTKIVKLKLFFEWNLQKYYFSWATHINFFYIFAFGFGKADQFFFVTSSFMNV